MKDLLKIIGIILILLMGSAVENAKAESRIEMTPKRLAISGVIDSSLFQQLFTVRATNSDVTELAFSPGNLMETSRGRTWITGMNVQITPAVSRIKRGQSQDFVVTVQNIPGSGQYEGTIAISYKEQGAESQDALSISVRAAKFSKSPPQIILKFEKGPSGLGETGNVPWTIMLNEDGGRASQEMMAALVKDTAVVLNPLINSDDKSQVIRPDQLLSQPAAPEIRHGVGGLIIKTNFTSPQVAAGKYTGALVVRSEGLGLLASIPVEVQVRYSSWLAWMLILAGIVVSMMVSYWNTTGKKKNAIQSEALKLREKLRSADITLNSSGQIEGMLDDMRELLHDDNLEDAQKKVAEATTTLETSVSNKKKLREKVVEVKGLIDDLENNVVEPVKHRVGADAAVLKTYLPSIKKALEVLKNDIEEERYEKIDDKLNQRVAELKSKLEAFTEPAPKGLLDGLAELEGDLSGLEQVYQSALEQHFIQPIKNSLRAIVRDKDVKEVADKIKNVDSQLREVGELIHKLKILNQQIQDGQHRGLNMSKAKEALKKCEEYLAHANIDMVKGHLPNIEKAINEALPPIAAPTVSARVFPEIIYHEAEAVPPSPPPVQPSARFKPSILNYLDYFSQRWTPERQERAISIVLYLLVISILAVIGFSQLYANNPTFGAENVWEEYLALFLWGFGIQTSMATVANVIKTFRRS